MTTTFTGDSEKLTKVLRHTTSNNRRKILWNDLHRNFAVHPFILDALIAHFKPETIHAATFIDSVGTLQANLEANLPGYLRQLERRALQRAQSEYVNFYTGMGREDIGQKIGTMSRRGKKIFELPRTMPMRRSYDPTQFKFSGGTQHPLCTHEFIPFEGCITTAHNVILYHGTSTDLYQNGDLNPYGKTIMVPNTAREQMPQLFAETMNSAWIHLVAVGNSISKLADVAYFTEQSVENIGGQGRIYLCIAYRSGLAPHPDSGTDNLADSLVNKRIAVLNRGPLRQNVLFAVGNEGIADLSVVPSESIQTLAETAYDLPRLAQSYIDNKGLDSILN